MINKVTVLFDTEISGMCSYVFRKSNFRVHTLDTELFDVTI